MKRAIAALLALVLALGAVVPTWAEETEEESTAPQATGETYDAGEDTAAPMMMLAARGAAATAASTGLDCTKGVAAGKIKEKFTGYVNSAMQYYIDNVSALKKGKPILFFFEGVSKRASDDNYRTVRQAAVCIAVTFDTPSGNPAIYYCEDYCSTIPDDPLKWKTSGYGHDTLRDGIYKAKRDNKDGSGYAVINIDPSKNYYDDGINNALQMKKAANKYELLYRYAPEKGTVRYDVHGHAGSVGDGFMWSQGCLLVGKSYSTFTDFMNGVTNHIYKSDGTLKTVYSFSKSSDGTPNSFSSSEKGDFGYVVIDRSQYKSELIKLYNDGGKEKGGYVSENEAAKAISELCVTSLAVKEEVDKQLACPYAPHDPGVTLSDGTYQFKTAQKDGKWTALCKECGVEYDYMASFNTEDAGVYKVVDTTGDGLCSAPYKEASISPLTVGNKVTVIGSVKNAYDNKWMQTADGWIYSGKLKRAENAPTIVNSGYCGGEGDGKNLSWTLDSEGLLTISGRGKMSSDNLYGGWMTWWGNELIYVTEIDIQPGVTTVGDSAFRKQDNLKKVTLPNTLTSIGHNAFEACPKLASITIPSSVISIGREAFKWTSLASIEIPNRVTYIGTGTFEGCASLTSIVLPNAVARIAGAAFKDCAALTSVTIPRSVEVIGRWAFSGCSALTDVYYGGTEEQWNVIDIDYENDPLTSATIHFGGASEPVKKPTVTAAGTKQEVKAGADGKMAITVPDVVNNKATTVTFDQAAVENISGYGDMTLTVKDNTANLSGTLKNSAEVKGKNAASIIVTLTKADGTPVFTEGTSAGEAVITIPYKTGLVSEKIRVFYVNGEKLTSQAFTYNALTGIVTLKLAHFSEYLIVSESEGAPEPTPTPTPTPTLEPTPTPAPTPNPTPTPGTGTTTPSHGQATASGTAGAKKASAETLDPGVGVYAVTAVLSLTGMAWIRRKRR